MAERRGDVPPGLPAGETDAELVARFLSGRDPAVFEELVRRHGPMVYRVCRRVLRHEQDAEDAFQATFLLLASRLRSLRRRGSLAAWLHGVARRVALKARARAAARRRRETCAPRAEEDDGRRQELLAALDAELAALPERWRSPLLLCHLEGLTQDEAASRLGWSKATLRRRLGEAREALDRRLRGRLDADLASAGPPLPPSLAEAAVAAVTGGAVSPGAAALAAPWRRRLAVIAVALLLIAVLGAAAWLLSLPAGGGERVPVTPPAETP
jgi:RNA polymerase sigma factor (sigma-70 family)